MTTAAPALACPHCQQPINLDASFTNHVEKQLARKYNTLYADEKTALAQREQVLKQQQKDLVAKTQQHDEAVQKAVASQITQLETKLRQKARLEQQTALDSLNTELDEKTKQIQTLQQGELDLRRATRQLEVDKAALKLATAKQLQAERAEIEARAFQKAQGENHLKTDEQHLLIQSLTGQLAGMKQQLEQKSQQMQGEVQELALERILREAFPFDQIDEVGKGINGADVIQTVRDEHVRTCGRIIYESKRTKTFSHTWIDKLRADVQAHKGDIAVLVTETMPKDCPQFAFINGVWVCSFAHVRALAFALRHQLLRVAEVQGAQVNQGEKMQLLYTYLTGTEFRHCVEGIMRAFQHLRDGLDQEKRAMKRIWAMREKHLDAVLDNTACFYGSVKTIAGAAVADLEAFALDTPEDEADSLLDAGPEVPDNV